MTDVDTRGETVNGTRVQIGVRINAAVARALPSWKDLIDYVLVEFAGSRPWTDEQRQRVRQVREGVDIVLHGFDSLSRPDSFSAETLQAMESMIEESDPLWFSEHICFTVPRAIDGQDGVTTFAAPLTPQTIDTVCANAIRLRDSADVPFLLENLGRPILWPWDVVDEVEAIRRIVTETGCELLLDLDQSRTSAMLRGMSLAEYVRELPLDRVHEVHVGLETEVDDVLEELLSHGRVRAITLEGAGDDPGVSQARLVQLHELAAQSHAQAVPG